MPKAIYLAFACDIWKSRDSMRLMLATTSPRKLKGFIARKIADGDIAYGDEGLDGREQIARFRRDVREEGLGRKVHDCLLYCHVQEAGDGEEL